MLTEQPRHLKKAIIFALLFALVQGVYGQTISDKLPQITKPSPQAWNFQKYGDYKVSPSTGIPDISIPLYEITAGELKMPIVLRYHASGIKFDEGDVSNVGLGWTLDVGGVITRTIMGSVDEKWQDPATFQRAIDISQDDANDVTYLSNIVTYKSKDVEYDHFAYSFVGQYGNFVIQKNGSTFNSYSYPHVPYKIDVQTTGTGVSTNITGIDITDDKGALYKFGHTHRENVASTIESAGTGWFLEEVTDATGKNKITLDYTAIPTFQIGSRKGMLLAGGDAGLYIPPGATGLPAGVCGTSVSLPFGLTNSSFGVGVFYDTKNLTSIVFPNGRVTFTLDASKRRIEYITVYNSNNQQIKKISFIRDTFPSYNSFYRLNRVEISDKNSSIVDKYSFGYNLPTILNSSSYTLDKWGYLNGTNATVMSYPAAEGRTVTFLAAEGVYAEPWSTTFNGINMTPNLAHSKSFTLNKIVYPTGGNTVFNYELNTYSEGGATKPGGGLRIKSIVSDEGTGNLTTKSYEYEPGFIEYPLSSENTYLSTSYSIEMICDYAVTKPIYMSVRHRTFLNEWQGWLGDNRVYYTKVTEIFGTGQTISGKKVYTYGYENPNERGMIYHGQGKMSNPTTPFYIKTYRNWGNGLLKKEQDYRYDGGAYTLIKEIDNTYKFVDMESFDNLMIQPITTYPSYTDIQDPMMQYYGRRDLIVNHGFSGIDLPYPYTVSDYRIVTGAYWLSSMDEYEYSEVGTVKTSTRYEYDNIHHSYPVHVLRSSSSGSDSTVTRNYYTSDYATAQPYTAMKSRNMLGILVGQREYVKRNGTEIQTRELKGNYQQFETNVFRPSAVQESKGQNGLEDRIRYEAYDKWGNPRQVSQAGGPPICYIWSYQGQFPVAEIRNASFSTVAALLGSTGAVDTFTDGIPTEASVSSFLAPLRNSASLKGSLITTYTYDPLVGMTTMTDASGKTTRYEYDSFGRLRQVNDSQSKAVEQYDYRYQNQ